MTFELFIFYLLTAIATISGLKMITVNNAVKASLWLVLAFIATAGIWIMAQAEFLGLVLILVYVGAVMVLFLFVIMMVDVNISALKEGFTDYLPIGIMASLAIFAMMYLVLGPEHFGIEVTGVPTVKPEGYSNTLELAIVLYTTHVYSFILAAVLLLIGIVTAISLALRHRPTTRVLYQDINKQVQTLARDRFKMVKIDSVIEKDILVNDEDKK